MHAYSKSIRHALSTVCGEWQSVLFAASRHSWGAACETWVSRSNSGFCLLLSPHMYFIYLFTELYFHQKRKQLGSMCAVRKCIALETEL